MTAQQQPAEERASELGARRIRGLMAEQRISGRQMAVKIGLEQRAFSRRHRGEVEWSIDEMDAIAHELGVSLVDLLARPERRTPAGGSLPPTGDSGAVRHVGLEPTTRCLQASIVVDLAEERAVRRGERPAVALFRPVVAAPHRRHLHVVGETA